MKIEGIMQLKLEEHWIVIAKLMYGQRKAQYGQQRKTLAFLVLVLHKDITTLLFYK